jgi:hypothetical protein
MDGYVDTLLRSDPAAQTKAAAFAMAPGTAAGKRKETHADLTLASRNPDPADHPDSSVAVNSCLRSVSGRRLPRH